MDNETSNECTLIDENGVPVVYAKTCATFPEEVLYSITKLADLNRISTLISQTCHGVIGTHGRTVELVFQPHIQKGLKDGSLKMMQTRSGETLADTIHVGGKSAGKIAGKGRIIEGGKLKQIATGSFQVISLIVAQAHLAEIDKNLADIKTSVQKIYQSLEDTHLAKIEGRIHYLENIIDKMRRGDFDYEVSLQIKNKIEDTVADAYEWQAILFSRVKSLTASAGALQNSDTFGTGDTFQKLKGIAEEINPLIQRRNILLTLAALLAYIQACIDPTNKEFSQLDLQRVYWESLLITFAQTVGQKSKTLLSQAKFNSQEMLDHRRFFIDTTLDSAQKMAEYSHAHYESSLLKLRNNHRQILTENGKLRLAVTHDERGEIIKAAVVD